MTGEEGQGDLFRLALEAAPTGMLMVEPTGTIALVNRELERLFGYGRDELVGQPVEMLLPERLRSRHAALRGGFFTQPSTRRMGERRDLFGLCKDGTEVPIEIGLNPLSIAGRTFVLSSVLDVSARKAIEREREALAASMAQAAAAETFRTVFDQSPIAMAILDANIRYTHVNAAWTRILGYERAELVGKSPVELTHPDDRAADEPLLAALVSARVQTYSCEKRYLRRDGSVVHVLLHAAAVNDAVSGRYFIGQIQDITLRVQAEQAVRELQAELARQAEISATVLGNMPRGALFLIDRELRCLSASGPSVPELVGVPAEALPGRNAAAMIPEAHREEVLGRLRATLAGEIITFEAVRGARTFEVRTAPIYSGEPAPVAALIHLYDVTERKQQAIALEAERERFRALVEDAPVGIFEMDAQGNVLYMNEQWRALAGLGPEQAREPTLRIAGVHPDDRSKLLATFGESIRAGRGYKVDYRYQPPSGQQKRLTSVAAPVRDHDGAVSGFIGITLDATAQLEAADAIARSLKEKETLLKEVHHRVKNNLQVIGSMIGLQANRIDDTRAQRVFDDLRGRIHAIALLHERLYRSRDLGAIDLFAYLEGLASDAARAAGAAPERIVVRGPPVPVALGIDEAVSVGLVANELVTNAFKHGSRGSTKARVEVALGLEGEDVELTVSDDGPGFPAGFAPEAGNTLGTLLLRRLAQQLGGEMLFSSEPTRGVLRFRLGGSHS
jgi:PAS domain S-box-containing protein